MRTHTVGQSPALTLTDVAALAIEEAAATAAAKRRAMSGETAERTLPGKLHPGVGACSRPVLSTSLFSFSKDLVHLTFTAEHPLALHTYPCPQYGNATLSYIGEQLYQADRRVLTFLIEKLRRREVDVGLQFCAREFCWQMGWGRDSRSVEKLDLCLVRMSGSSLKVTHSRGWFLTRFVLEATATGQYRFVRLHSDLASFFTAGHTYLPCAEYRELTDGFATWLQGFLRAHDDELQFKFADIQAASGSDATVKAFGEMLRETLPKLQKVGVAVGYECGRGTLRNAEAAAAARAAKAAKAAKAAERAARTAAALHGAEA